jgi:ATP-dependent metalloprotease FtsH
MLIMVAGISVFAEGMAGNVQKGFGMGSKKIQPVEEVNTTFEDVKGCSEVKDELQEIVLYLKDPNRFTRLGAKLPKGVLMSGSPGTGKTLLARAIAGEAGVPFFQASGSEFEEMFVGVGARRLRDLFAEARKHAPCIVFLDEVDAVGSKRSNRDNTAVRMTLNQLLVELDGFEQNNGIVVICATNFPESLDKALTRPGRLDKQVVVPIPDLKGRMEILQLYASKLVLSVGVDLETIAKRTAGMTGADLFNILNIAAVRSAGDDCDAVNMKYLEEAFDRVVVGLERKNPMSDQEKRLTAYHEGGHTLVSMGNTGADPVHKATIMPRGQALGITWSIPDREKYSERVFELQARLEVLMGGKAAEEIIFGPQNVTAGCTSDLRQATSLARRMVMNFGMADDSMPAPLSLDIDEYAVLSDEVKHQIDTKTQSLMTNAYQRAADHLRQHEKELHRLAEALVEYETLSLEEIKLAIVGESTQIAVKRKEQEDMEKAAPPLAPKEVSGKKTSHKKRTLASGPSPVVEDGAEGTE